MSNLHRRFAVAAAIVSLSAACTLQETDVPPLTGPSTLALALDVTASPDILPEDGTSTSVIRIVARDQNNQPVSGLSLRVDTVIGDAIVDIGTLSARNVTTNASGEASVLFTAPRPRFPGSDTQSVVSVRVLQVGTNFGTTFPRDVNIRLVPETVVSQPGAPRASFTFAPASPKVGDVMVFNGAGSSDEDGTIVSYRWTFSDGYAPQSQTVVMDHDFTTPGTHFVTLTVTDNQGKTGSVTRFFTVGAQ
jgi:PKD repeat protein